MGETDEVQVVVVLHEKEEYFGTLVAQRTGIPDGAWEGFPEEGTSEGCRGRNRAPRWEWEQDPLWWILTWKEREGCWVGKKALNHKPRSRGVLGT